MADDDREAQGDTRDQRSLTCGTRTNWACNWWMMCPQITFSVGLPLRMR